MRADEYDALIADPTAFLYNVWLPRASTEVSKIGQPSTYRNNLSFVKGAMAMLSYFYAFGPPDRPAPLRVRHRLRHRRHLQGPLRHPRRQAARLCRPDDGHADAARQSPQGLRSPHAPPVPRRPDHRRPGQASAHRLLDAPRLRALHQPQDLRLPQLAHPQAHHRGVLEERPPDPLLRRRQMAPSLRRLPRTARPQHRLPLRPGRHLPRPPQAARQVRPQRRHPQCAAQLRQTRRSPRLLPARH